MNQDDLMLAREGRRHLERRPIDSTLANITVSKGYLIVSGQIKGLKSEPFVDVKHEVDVFYKTAKQQMRGIKDIILECRVIPQPKKEKEVEGPDQSGTHSHLPVTRR